MESRNGEPPIGVEAAIELALNQGPMRMRLEQMGLSEEAARAALRERMEDPDEKRPPVGVAMELADRIIRLKELPKVQAAVLAVLASDLDGIDYK